MAATAAVNKSVIPKMNLNINQAVDDVSFSTPVLTNLCRLTSSSTSVSR